MTRVDADGGAVTLALADLLGGPGRTLDCDGVVLATGYDRGLDRDVFGEVLEYLDTADHDTPDDDTADGAELPVSPDYRVRTRPDLAG